MALTPSQIQAALKISQTFNIQNASAPVNFAFYNDNTNWAALGLSVGHGDTVKIIEQLLDPTGTVVYQNTGWGSGSFASPDTTLASLQSAQKNLNTYTGTTIAIAGEYVLNLQIQVTPVTLSPILVNATFTLNLNSDFVPSVAQQLEQPVGGSPIQIPQALCLNLQETYNCNNATYTSNDITNYYNPTGWNVVSVVRSHTVTPPNGSTQSNSITPQSAVTGNFQQILLAATANPLWTGPYQSSLTSTVTYTDGTNTLIDHATIYVSTVVACDNNYCRMQNCIDRLIQLYQQACYKGAQVDAQNFYAIWDKCSNYFQAVKDADLCSNPINSAAYIESFYNAAKPYCTDLCGCSGNPNTPSPVIPTSSIVGPTGPTGPTGPQGPQGPAGAAGAAAVSIIYNQFPNTETTGTGSLEALTTVQIPANTLTNDYDMMHIRCVWNCGQGGENTSFAQQAQIIFNNQQISGSLWIFDNADLQVITADIWLTRLTSTTAQFEFIVKSYTTSGAFDYPYNGLALGVPEVHGIASISSGLDFTTNMNVVAQGKSANAGVKQVTNSYLRIEYEPA